jgi:hypothetical protein
MVTDRMTKRMIDFQKSTFDMMLNTMGNIQEQSGRATQAFFEQMAGLPQEGVKSMNHWMDSVRQTREEFNSIVRDGYENWGNIFQQTAQRTEEAMRRHTEQAARKATEKVSPEEEDEEEEPRQSQQSASKKGAKKG